MSDVLPTNRSNCFHKNSACQTGLNDSNKIVLTIFRSAFFSLSHKLIKHRSYKSFNKEMFCQELHIGKAKSDQIIKKFWNLIKSFMKKKVQFPRKTLLSKLRDHVYEKRSMKKSKLNLMILQVTKKF